jgi:hypothetical protein
MFATRSSSVGRRLRALVDVGLEFATLGEYRLGPETGNAGPERIPFDGQSRPRRSSTLAGGPTAARGRGACARPPLGDSRRRAPRAQVRA